LGFRGREQRGDRLAESIVSLDEMTSERCEALILHDVHGYDLNEVAELMNISVAAVQSRLVARYRLRCQLEAAERLCDERPDGGPRRAR
jgi:DNA-directed RNA polymerase specialized sigma24 family protein